MRAGNTRQRTPARRLRRVLVGLGLVLVVGWGGSNLLLNSAWGRSKVSAQLVSRTGFDWTVGGAGWSPWGGAVLSELEAAYPGTEEQGIPPVLVVREVRVKPHWLQLLRGRKKLKEVVVDGPRGELAVEMLAAMVPSRRPVEPVAGGPVAESTAQPESAAPPAESGAVDPVPGLAESGEETAEEPVREVPGREDAKEAVDPGPPLRVEIHDAALKLYSLTRPEVALEVLGMTANLPAAGPEASGWVELDEVRLAGQQLLSGLRVELEWQRPILRIPERTIEVFGLPVRFEAKVLSGRRVFSAVGLRVERTPWAWQEVPGFPGARVGGELVEGFGRIEGELLRPSTWQCNLAAAGQGLVLENEGRELADFEYGRVSVDFRNGILQIPDARLTSETFSLLGNGRAGWDGQVLGVLRVITDAYGNEVLTRGAISSHLSHWTGSWLEPLETPDRLYRDIHLQGPITGPRLDLGRGEHGIEVWQAWQQVAAFMRREQVEEALGVPHSPERDALLYQK